MYTNGLKSIEHEISKIKESLKNIEATIEKAKDKSKKTRRSRYIGNWSGRKLDI